VDEYLCGFGARRREEAVKGGSWEDEKKMTGWDRGRREPGNWMFL